MKVKLIRTKGDYEFALKTLETLIDAKVDTAEGKHLVVFVTLI